MLNPSNGKQDVRGRLGSLWGCLYPVMCPIFVLVSAQKVFALVPVEVKAKVKKKCWEKWRRRIIHESDTLNNFK